MLSTKRNDSHNQHQSASKCCRTGVPMWTYRLSLMLKHAPGTWLNMSQRGSLHPCQHMLSLHLVLPSLVTMTTNSQHRGFHCHVLLVNVTLVLKKQHTVVHAVLYASRLIVAVPFRPRQPANIMNNQHSNLQQTYLCLTAKPIVLSMTSA